MFPTLPGHGLGDFDPDLVPCVGWQLGSPCLDKVQLCHAVENLTYIEGITQGSCSVAWKSHTSHVSFLCQHQVLLSDAQLGNADTKLAEVCWHKR